MGKNQKIGEGMRWLYDDEASYQKAVRKMRIEAAREERRKQLARKVRAERLDAIRDRIAGLFRSVSRVRMASRLRRGHTKLYIAGGVIAIGLLVAIPFSVRNDNSPTVTDVQGAQDQKAPEFDTVLPGGDQSLLAGKVVYDEQRKVASYVDMIGDAKVTVSEQQLPERFKQDRLGELEKFAKQINANEKIEVGEVVAFSGVSIKGPQTVVFIKNDVLVFMGTEKKLQNKAWFDYIANLQ